MPDCGSAYLCHGSGAVVGPAGCIWGFMVFRADPDAKKRADAEGVQGSRVEERGVWGEGGGGGNPWVGGGGCAKNAQLTSCLPRLCWPDGGAQLMRSLSLSMLPRVRSISLGRSARRNPRKNSPEGAHPFSRESQKESGRVFPNVQGL